MKKSIQVSLIFALVSGLFVSCVLYYALIVKKLRTDLLHYVALTAQGETIDPALTQKILQNSKKINTVIQKIGLSSFDSHREISNDLYQLLELFFTSKQNYVVILQNSDEIRATGGFMGSYLMLKNDHGQIDPLIINDIYAPDGQFTGYVAAPAGAAEYLSSGKGLRLPDANWWFDSAKSGEQILYFFEASGETNLDGVVFINLQLIEQLLQATGPIYLPDYKQTVDADSFATLARTDRSQFFPGSQEKVNFLNHFFTVFKTRLLEIAEQQPQLIIDALQQAIALKNIQAYSRDTFITQLLTNYQLHTTVSQQPGLNYFLLESNVGINKANRLVTRAVEMHITPDRETITILFTNANPFAYVNYQRIYVPTSTQFLEATLHETTGTTKTLSVDQKIEVDSSGQAWTEIGTLISVLGQSQTKVSFHFTTPLSLQDKKTLHLFKQAGLAPTIYHVTITNEQGSEQNQSIELGTDRAITFE